MTVKRTLDIIKFLCQIDAEVTVFSLTWGKYKGYTYTGKINQMHNNTFQLDDKKLTFDPTVNYVSAKELESNLAKLVIGHETNKESQ